MKDCELHFYVVPFAKSAMKAIYDFPNLMGCVRVSVRACVSLDAEAGPKLPSAGGVVRVSTISSSVYCTTLIAFSDDKAG